MTNREKEPPGPSTSAPIPASRMNPGDLVPPGTPGSGENICRACHGLGRIDGRRCDQCGGSGHVIEGIGGA